MKIIKLAVIATALMATAATAKTDHTGCEIVPIMSTMTPGKVLYYNYVDATCLAPLPGTRFITVGFDAVTGAPIRVQQDR
jgi:hypothetical protein